jgi:hypothetical protein
MTQQDDYGIGGLDGLKQRLNDHVDILDALMRRLDIIEARVNGTQAQPTPDNGELLPCPECGNNDIHISDEENAKETGYFMAFCPCKQSPVIYGKTRALARRRWNAAAAIKDGPQ